MHDSNKISFIGEKFNATVVYQPYCAIYDPFLESNKIFQKFDTKRNSNKISLKDGYHNTIKFAWKIQHDKNDKTTGSRFFIFTITKIAYLSMIEIINHFVILSKF